MPKELKEPQIIHDSIEKITIKDKTGNTLVTIANNEIELSDGYKIILKIANDKLKINELTFNGQPVDVDEMVNQINEKMSQSLE